MISWKNRRRACDAVCKEADLILYVVDSSRPLDENDRQIIEMIRDQKVIVLLNKSDLEAAVSETDLQEAFGGREVSMIRTSAKKNAGIEEFEQLLEQMFSMEKSVRRMRWLSRACATKKPSARRMTA